MATVEENMAQAQERIRSILLALEQIRKRPDVVEDGSDSPWPLEVLKETDRMLWEILEAADGR